MTGFQIRRAEDRAVTETGWLNSRHSFAFGRHYDPGNLGYGPLIAVNSDLVQPGPGYQNHRHAGTEILTWVLAGVLEHEAAGRRTLIRPGQLQYLSTGTGIEHAERSADQMPVQVVQMWLVGRSEDEPVHQVEAIPDGSWVLAAAAHHPAPIRLRHTDAELWRSVLPAGGTVELPATDLFLFVLSGTVTVDGERLNTEDAGQGRAERLQADTAAEVLVWTMSELRTLDQ